MYSLLARLLKNGAKVLERGVLNPVNWNQLINDCEACPGFVCVKVLWNKEILSFSTLKIINYRQMLVKLLEKLFSATILTLNF
jgi:hypothetical protein